MSHKFGKFPSVAAFLDHHARAKEQAAAAAERGLTFEQMVDQRRQQARAVVEVAATLKRIEPEEMGQADHLRLIITLTKIIQPDATVATDIDRVLADGEDVLVAVRVGGSEGISRPIQGLVVGVGLDIKGVWIPKDQAYSDGGDAVSVLHFTHSPLGFICVAQPAACYQ